MQPYGVLACFGVRRIPKGNEGKRVSSGYNRRRRLATRSSGKQQAERTAVRTAPIVCPEESPLVRPQAHTLCPGWGLTRRLRRGSRACSPMGRSHFSFGGERKVCKRKPAARRLREKGFYCPFWRRGSLCRAQHDWPNSTCDPARSELAFFRRQNGRAFFPPLPIAALAPAVGVGHTQALPVGIFWRGLADSAGPQASGFWKQRWPLARAARPVAERRYLRS